MSLSPCREQLLGSKFTPHLDPRLHVFTLPHVISVEPKLSLKPL